MLLKLNLAFAVETIALIASLFLLIYINKNQLSKWYRYAGISIFIFVIGLMLCTATSCFKMCGHGRKSGCEMGGGKQIHKMYMNKGMNSGGCDMMMQGCGNKMSHCGKGMGMNDGSNCKMNKNSCCEMGSDDACCEMSKGKCDMDMGDSNDKAECKMKCKKDSIVKKEVIIKK